MLSLMIWIVVIACISTCLYLWFRDVRRIMRERKSTVDSAAEQLAAYRRKVAGVRYDPDLAKVLARSESIYLQAVKLYHQSLHKPWIRLPAVLMGFRSIPEEVYYTLGRTCKR